MVVVFVSLGQLKGLATQKRELQASGLDGIRNEVLMFKQRAEEDRQQQQAATTTPE